MFYGFDRTTEKNKIGHNVMYKMFVLFICIKRKKSKYMDFLFDSIIYHLRKYKELVRKTRKLRTCAEKSYGGHCERFKHVPPT